MNALAGLSRRKLLGAACMCALVIDALAAPRAVEFNGQSLDAAGWQTLWRIEVHIGPVPDGRYWYDMHSGAADVAGGWGLDWHWAVRSPATPPAVAAVG